VPFVDPVDGLAKCGSSAARNYTLSDYDKSGVRCLYNSAAGACRGSQLSEAARSFSAAQPTYAADGNGNLYRAKSDNSAVERYVPRTAAAPAKWVTMGVAANSKALHAGGSTLYRVDTSNRLYRWSGTAWVDLNSDAGKALAVSYATGDLFRLATNGTVTHLAPTSQAWSAVLSSVDNSRKLFAGSKKVYRLDGTGALWAWSSGTTWNSLPGTFVAAAETRKMGTGVVDDLYALDSAGVVKRRSGAGWVVVGGAAAPAMSKLWGGLDTLYATPSAAGTTARRLQGTTFVEYATAVTHFFGGGPRRLAVIVEGGATKLFDYMFAQ
jgi:hypothetical protein